MSYEEGALVEPLAIGINAAKTADIWLGETVLVYGAGCIGLVSMLAAKAYGATTVYITDRIEKRLETAQELGGIPLQAGKVDAVAEVNRLTGERGVDVALDCAGFSSTVAGSIQACRPGGRMVVIGMGEEALN